MKSLLAGEKIAFIKSAESWNTDLKALCTAKKSMKTESGLCYEDYLMLLLAKKGEEKVNICYARMLDVIELNLQKNDETFQFSNCVGEMTIQGKVSVNPLFIGGKEDVYDYYFEEKLAY